jgi:hypothetical protein
MEVSMRAVGYIRVSRVGGAGLDRDRRPRHPKQFKVAIDRFVVVGDYELTLGADPDRLLVDPLRFAVAQDSLRHQSEGRPALPA